MEKITKRGVTCVRLDNGKIVKNPVEVERLLREMEQEWTTEDSSTQLDLIE